MRVIAGKLKGRKLRPVPSRGVRPTSDRVREALFARLGCLEARRVLDLFAGTGALGIEAISRGAAEAVFVEHANAPLAVLRANLSDLKLGDCTEILRMDAVAAIRRMGRQRRTFDLIFVDPPYASQEVPEVVAGMLAVGLLAPEVEVIVERSKHSPPARVEGLSFIDEREYGDTVITRWGRLPELQQGRESDPEEKEEEGARRV